MTAPPHGFSRGNGYFSNSNVLNPSCAQSRAAIDPAGPAPTTMTSYVKDSVYLPRSVVTIDRLQVPLLDEVSLNSKLIRFSL